MMMIDDVVKKALAVNNAVFTVDSLSMVSAWQA